MRQVLAATLVVAVMALSGCASKFKTYAGPEVTRVAVFKESRRMYLYHGDQVLKAYAIELGRVPYGHKIASGDGRTPEGEYLIDRRNPNSKYHLSIGIDYPRTADVAVARGLGLDPGGDIFIHGTPKKASGRDDWTWGCIAISNEEIEDVYAMVRDGTPISIYP